MRTAAAVASVTALSALVWAHASGAQDSGAVAAGAHSYDARDLALVRVVGIIEIESGGDRISVDYDPGEGLLDAPEFDIDGDTLEITQLGWRTRVRCRSRIDRREVEVGDDGYHPLTDYGTWRIRIPEGVSLDIRGGAVSGMIGDVGELALGLGSCGSVEVGDIAEDAHLAVNGSGDIRVGDVGGDADLAVNGSGDTSVGSVGGGLAVAINGSGDVMIGAVAEGVAAAINGSGDVEIAALAGGDLDVAINGSGDVTVLAGEASSISVAVRGSGDVRFAGVAERVNLSASGSGDVYVDDVTGPVRTSARGSGRVHIGTE